MRKLTLSSILLILSSMAQADFLAFGVETRFGSYAMTSAVADTDGSDSFALEEELGMDDPDGSYVGAFFEHPLPILPNVAYARTAMSSSNSGQPSSNVSFMGRNFASDASSKNELEHAYQDLTIYWKPLPGIIPIVSLNTGLTYRTYDSSFSMTNSAGATEELIIDHSLPLFALGGRVDIPVLPIYASVAYKRDLIPSLADDLEITVEDMNYELGYEFLLGFGVALGKSVSDLNIDAENSASADYASDFELQTANSYLSFFFRF